MRGSLRTSSGNGQPRVRYFKHSKEIFASLYARPKLRWCGDTDVATIAVILIIPLSVLPIHFISPTNNGEAIRFLLL